MNKSMSLGAYWRAQEARFATIDTNQTGALSSSESDSSLKSLSEISNSDNSDSESVTDLLPGGMTSLRQVEAWKRALSVKEHRAKMLRRCQQLVMCRKTIG